MKTVSAVGFPDLLQPEFLRFLFCPAQHGSLPIDSKKREPEQPDEAVPALPSSAVVTLNLGNLFRLANMSGRSLPRAHNRRDAALAANPLPCAARWPRSRHRLSRSNSRSTARRPPRPPLRGP